MKVNKEKFFRILLFIYPFLFAVNVPKCSNYTEGELPRCSNDVPSFFNDSANYAFKICHIQTKTRSFIKNIGTPLQPE